MGGAIDINSRLGRGTTVCVNLPIVIGEGHGESPDVAGIQLSGQRVLVVDSERSSRRIVHSYLKAGGCEVVCVGNAARAMKELKEAADMGAPFALVMVDRYCPVSTESSLSDASGASRRPPVRP